MNRLRCLLLLSAALAGCSAAPTRYYTLVAPPPAHQSAAHAAFAIDVQSVAVPAQVDQPSLVVRQGQGQLALAEKHQWIAPLPNEIRDALSAALSTQLGAADLHGDAAPKGEPVWRIGVDVQRFESELNRHSVIDAVWSLRKLGDARPSLVCSSQIEESVGTGWPALIAGHQRALQQLATTIATRVSALQSGVAAQCP